MWTSIINNRAHILLQKNRYIQVLRFRMSRVEGNLIVSVAKATSGAEGDLVSSGRALEIRSFRGGRVPARMAGGVIPDAGAIGDSSNLVGGVPTLHRQDRTELRRGANDGGGPIVGPWEGVAVLPTLLPHVSEVTLSGDK